MSTTPKFGITDITDQQANAETTHNTSVRILEAMASRAVKDRDLTSPPGSPSDGDVYICAASSSGDWSGKDLHIAVYITDAWSFITPEEGNEMYLQDENLVVFYNGSQWIARGGLITLTDASTVAWDTSKGSNAKVTLTTSRTIGAPTNLTVGMIYTLQVIQPGAGESGYSRATASFNSIFVFKDGSAGGSNGANKVDLWGFIYDGSKMRETFRRPNVT